jgi:hypothetical protein
MFAWLNNKMGGGEGGNFLTLYAGSLMGGRPSEAEEKQRRWEKEAERHYFRGRRLIAGHRYSQQSNLARDAAKGKDLLARAAEMGHPLAAVDISCCTKAASHDQSRIDWIKARRAPPPLLHLAVKSFR